MKNFTMKNFYGGTSFVFILGTIAYAFHRGLLTAEQRWLLASLMAIFAATTASQFTGGLKVQTKIGAMVVAATAGFATWFLHPYLFPIPVVGGSIIVELSSAKGLLPIDFQATYRRARLANVTAKGVEGEATITDLPSGTTSLEIVRLEPDRIRIDAPLENGAWVFPIDKAGHVSIPATDQYQPLEVPTNKTIETMIHAAKISKDQVLAQRLAEDEKKTVVLTVSNNSGRGITLWGYDCWWCYNERPKGALTQTSSFMEFAEFRDVASATADFKMFELLKSTSGYFALFIDYKDHGKSRRHTIGIRNLYEPKSQALQIGVDQFNELTCEFQK